MKSANISELRDRLSYYIRRVSRGETIEVLDRNRPVARLVPTPSMPDQAGALLTRLQNSGLIRVGPMQGVRQVLDLAPSSGASAGVLDALIEERRTGR